MGRALNQVGNQVWRCAAFSRLVICCGVVLLVAARPEPSVMVIWAVSTSRFFLNCAEIAARPAFQVPFPLTLRPMALVTVSLIGLLLSFSQGVAICDSG